MMKGEEFRFGGNLVCTSRRRGNDSGIVGCTVLFILFYNRSLRSRKSRTEILGGNPRLEERDSVTLRI